MKIVLGWDHHIPGGCDELTTQMDTFEDFLSGIGNYDLWVYEITDRREVLELDGREVLEEKVKIKKNYEDVRKEVTRR